MFNNDKWVAVNLGGYFRRYFKMMQYVLVVDLVVTLCTFL